MGIINSLRSSIPIVVSQESQTEPTTQSPSPVSGIAGNLDVLEVAVPNQYNSFEQQSMEVASPFYNFAEEWSGSDAVLQAVMSQLDPATSTSENPQVKEFSERLKSLNERYTELKQQIVALFSEVDQAQRSGDKNRVAALQAKIMELQAELQAIAKEIMSILQEIQKIQDLQPKKEEMMDERNRSSALIRPE